jgi:SAM-dependent methyltransferase
MSAIAHWKHRVEAHHAQSIRAQDEAQMSEDFWAPFASFFRVDPRRIDDPVLDRLAREIKRSSTLLDVGGGAGRFALPLALRCRHVTVVEPSGSMLQGLREGMQEAGIKNITSVQATWEEATVEPADVALCAHVVYGVADIEPFIRKLEAHARQKVLLLAFMDSPIARFSPFWKPVHGEERVDLPGLPELVNVLWEMDICPDVEMLESASPRAFESRESALEQLRARLYVKPDTERDRRLQSAMDELLVETPDGVGIRGAKLRRQGLIAWRPA